MKLRAELPTGGYFEVEVASPGRFDATVHVRILDGRGDGASMVLRRDEALRFFEAALVLAEESR